MGRLAVRLGFEISSRTQRAVLWAMNLHPADRPPTVEIFKEALLGDWNPASIPGAILPNPKIEDVFSSRSERTLAILAMGLALIGLIVTLAHI